VTPAVNVRALRRNKRSDMQLPLRSRRAALALAAALSFAAARPAHADPPIVTDAAPAPAPAPVVATAAPVEVAAPPAAPAAKLGEIQLGVDFGGEGSSWAGDGAGFVGIRGGFRFIDLIAPYFLARAGYATVNQRVLELIQIGAQIWGRLGITRPYLRLGLVHQHEESWAAYKADYIGSFLGVADGIRHRGGGEFALGMDVPVLQKNAWQLHLTFEGLATVFPPDQKGPRAYGGGTFGLGFNYGL